MSMRATRVGEQMKRIGRHLRQKAKRSKNRLLTVTDVEVSGDLQIAKVYISVLGDEKKREETLKGLAKAKGYIRSEIGNRIRLRKTPELHFEFDESVDYGNRIESLIAELNTKDHE